MLDSLSKKHGFTIVELVVVFALVGGMAALFLPNLLGSRGHAEVRSNLYSVIGDIKSQQLKAMLGDTEGRGTNSAYGVHFETSTYTLFHGASYNPLDSNNAVVKLPEDLQFTQVTLPQATILFQKGNGEVLGFVQGADGFTLIATSTNEALGVIFNQLGVVNQIQ